MKNVFFFLPVVLSLLLAPSELTAQIIDDFNDGNDAGWTRYDPLGSHPALPDQATFTLANGTYRIQVAASPDPSTLGPARAGSVRTDVTYSNFFISVDLIDWDETTDQSFGMLARIREPGLGTTDGYAMTFNIGGGDFDITWFNNEDPNAPNGAAVVVAGEDNFTMTKGRVYRFQFIGKGEQLTARAFELPDVYNPLVSITGTDAHFTEGFSGLLVYDNSGGTGIADATFDNYVSLDYEPPQLKFEIVNGFGDTHVSWPAEFTDFTLQCTSDLTSPDWTDVGGVLDNGFIRYVEGSIYDADQRFYRLVRPGSP